MARGHVPDLVGEAALAPVIQVDHLAALTGEAGQEAVDRRLDVLLLQTGVEDHHEFVFTHATVTSSGLERPPDGSRSVNPPEGSSGPDPGQRGLAARLDPGPDHSPVEHQ